MLSPTDAPPSLTPPLSLYSDCLHLELVVKLLKGRHHSRGSLLSEARSDTFSRLCPHCVTDLKLLPFSLPVWGARLVGYSLWTLPRWHILVKGGFLTRPHRSASWISSNPVFSPRLFPVRPVKSLVFLFFTPLLAWSFFPFFVWLHLFLSPPPQVQTGDRAPRVVSVHIYKTSRSRADLRPWWHVGCDQVPAVAVFLWRMQQTERWSRKMWNADSCSAGLCLHLLFCSFSASSSSLIIWFETISKCLRVVGESLRVSSQTGLFLPVPESLFVMSIYAFWSQVLFCVHSSRCSLKGAEQIKRLFLNRVCCSILKVTFFSSGNPYAEKTHWSRWRFLKAFKLVEEEKRVKLCFKRTCVLSQCDIINHS